MLQLKINIAIFASGSGTNAENLVHYFRNRTTAGISLIVCNKPDAFVLERAAKLGVESLVVNRTDWNSPEKLIYELQKRKIDLIVLAGFLWLIPAELIDAFPRRIINIHPALLPKYGGKGMYGDRVHESVKEKRDTETGITIHYIDNKYDTGDIIFQKSVSIDPVAESGSTIAAKVHELEYKWYPQIIAQVAEMIQKNKSAL